MNKKFLFIACLIICISKQTSAYYLFDKRIEQAYNAILLLQFDSAEGLLQQEKTEKPGNNLQLVYLNYIDFLKAFISEEKSDFEKLKAATSKRIRELNSVKENSSSPFHLYVQSEMLIQQALVSVKFEENFSSANDIRKAYKLIVRNEILFPEFILNKKVSGFLHALIGAVPSKYQWAVNLTGMQGSLTKGLTELQELYKRLDSTSYSCFRTEILFYLGNIYSAFSMSAISTSIVNNMKPLIYQSPLIAFVYSNIMTKQGENDEAKTALDACLNYNASYPFYFLYYKRGLTKLRKLDLSAEIDFEYFLNHFKGINYRRSAYQKLAWISLLRGDSSGYFNRLTLARGLGALMVDEDKDAQYDAQQNEIVNSHLLRSRLYFDGGYYNKSLSEIAGKSINEFPHFKEQLEITYRLGRIMQMTGQINRAIGYFEMTLKNGSSSVYYFAANSSLMLGLIYEDMHDFVKAKFYFQKCLTMKSEQYRNSIEQKAKAGLERIQSQ